MARRLPRPKVIKHVQGELSEEEMALVEEAAHKCRLSLASFARVALILASSADHIEAMKTIAEKIITSAPPEQKRPGRPKAAG